MSEDQVLSFLICGVPLQVKCPDGQLRSQLLANFGQLAFRAERAELKYVVRRAETPPFFSITRAGHALSTTSEDGDFLFLLEKDVTLELQKRRSDLYFLHSAAMEFKARAALLVAESGGGKSTTAWGLLHHGLRYMSDELSPIDPQSLKVYPYPHALCLKRTPPRPYTLPEETLYTQRSLHVPVSSMGGEGALTPCPLGSVFFLKYRSDTHTPQVRAISKATAAALLYTNTLNALAHPNSGLDIAARIASAVPCFSVDAGELQATCAVIEATLAQSHQ